MTGCVVGGEGEGEGEVCIKGKSVLLSTAEMASPRNISRSISIRWGLVSM